MSANNNHQLFIPSTTPVHPPQLNDCARVPYGPLPMPVPDARMAAALRPPQNHFAATPYGAPEVVEVERPEAPLERRYRHNPYNTETARDFVPSPPPPPFEFRVTLANTPKLFAQDPVAAATIMPNFLSTWAQTASPVVGANATVCLAGWDRDLNSEDKAVHVNFRVRDASAFVRHFRADNPGHAVRLFASALNSVHVLADRSDLIVARGEQGNAALAHYCGFMKHLSHEERHALLQGMPCGRLRVTLPRRYLVRR